MTKAEMIKAAFDVALQTRKFEISLYWKRAQYFFNIFSVLGGTTVLLSAITPFVSNNSKHLNILFLLLIIIECIGLVSAVAWVLVNNGSKYWQENWEQYVDVLGEENIGPLFRFPITDSENLRRYSVSKVNLKLSCYIVTIWALFIIGTITIWACPALRDSSVFCCLSVMFAVCVLLCSSVFIIWMSCRSKGGSTDDKGSEDSNIKMYIEEVERITKELSNKEQQDEVIHHDEKNKSVI